MQAGARMRFGMSGGGTSLMEFTQRLEDEARKQGFVIIDGGDFLPHGVPFANDNTEDCGCPPGFCAADEEAQFDPQQAEFEAMVDFLGMIFGAPMEAEEETFELEVEEGIDRETALE